MLRFQLEEIEYAMENCIGFCISCGEGQICYEPDARLYECEACKKLAVYGAQELIIMDLVD